MTEAFPITIYHNPACGTSRNVLAIVRAAGYAPDVVDYLEAGWTRPLLDDLLARLGVGPRDLLREKGTSAAALGLTALEATDEAILTAMLSDPLLVNRPIVATPLGTRLCRPSETVIELLDRRPDSFTKEDGEIVRL